MKDQGMKKITWLPDWLMKYTVLNIRGYAVIFVLALLQIALSCADGSFYLIHFDTHSYFKAIDTIFSGNIDAYRTPVYPLILGCLKSICGDIQVVYVWIVILQWLFFLYSAVYLGKFLKVIGIVGHVAFFVVLAYVLSPNINGYNYFVTTESFAVSSMVFLLWWGWKCYDSQSVRNQVMLWGMVLLMIFLRPIFLYLIPVMAVYEIVVWKVSNYGRKYILSVLSSILITVGCLGLYVNRMSKAFNVPSLTIVSYHNNYHVVRGLHALPNGDFENAVLVAAVDSIYKADPDNADLGPIFDEIFELQDRFGYGACNDFVMRAISENKPQVVCKVLGHFYKASQYKAFNNHRRSSLWELFAPGFNLIYIVMIIWSYLIIRLIYVRRSIDPITLMAWMLFVSGVLVAIIGAPSDYGRLTMPCAAPLMVFFGWFCSHLRWHDHCPK